MMYGVVCIMYDDDDVDGDALCNIYDDDYDAGNDVPCMM